MLGRLEALCNLNGASGDEGRVRRYIRDIAKEYADEVWVDTMGNLYAHKKGEGRRVMVCAHMDEVGMIVWGAMDNGLNPTTTLGCGTWGNNIISENLWYTHLMNVSRISYKVPSMYVPSDEEIWAE